MRRILIASSVALLCTGVIMASVVNADARKRRRSKETKDLVVTLLTPTNNQEVLPDMSDPG